MVYQSIEPIEKQILGILTTYFLAILNNYKFAIANLQENKLAEIFTSPEKWWSKEWSDFAQYHGILNLNNWYEETVYKIKDVTLDEVYPKSTSIQVYCNQNFIPTIFENPNYTKKIEKLELNEATIFNELFTHLFTQFESKYLENYNFLLKKILEYGDDFVAVRINKIDDQLIKRILDTKKKNIFISSPDENNFVLLKNKLSDKNVFHIAKIVDVENQKELDTVKMFYELKIFQQFQNILIDDTFSDVCKLFEVKE